MDPRHNLRLTTALKKRLAVSAIDAGRSVNAEIVHRLEKSFEPDLSELRPLINLSDQDRAKAIELLRQLSELLARAKQ